ncbi:unnamed protein product, partial [marine sediment metagenome]
AGECMSTTESVRRRSRLITGVSNMRETMGCPHANGSVAA